jgi:hypothetical protein
MRDILLSASHLFIDETEVHVLDPGGGHTKTGYFWAIARDGRPYGSQDVSLRERPPSNVWERREDWRFVA